MPRQNRLRTLPECRSARASYRNHRRGVLLDANEADVFATLLNLPSADHAVDEFIKYQAFLEGRKRGSSSLRSGASSDKVKSQSKENSNNPLEHARSSIAETVKSDRSVSNKRSQRSSRSIIPKNNRFFLLRDIERIRALSILQGHRTFAFKIIQQTEDFGLKPGRSGWVWRDNCEEHVWTDLKASFPPPFEPNTMSRDNYEIHWSVGLFVAKKGSDIAEYYGEYIILNAADGMGVRVHFVNFEVYPGGLHSLG